MADKLHLAHLHRLYKRAAKRPQRTLRGITTLTDFAAAVYVAWPEIHKALKRKGASA